MTADRAIGVAIATDALFYREGLAGSLGKTEGFEVVDVADDASSALRLVLARRPDILLLDAGMTGSYACARELHAKAPDTSVVVIAIVDELGILPWAEAGAVGYVTRGTDLEGLVGTLRSVANGESPCSPRVAAAVMRRLAELASAGAPSSSGPSSLTGREVEIVGLIDSGMSNKEIARRLYIELSTVKNHVHRILEKLDVTTRAEAAAAVRRHRGATV